MPNRTYKGWEFMRDIVPKGYVCHRSPHRLVIDGTLTDPAWERAPWTDDFTDIEADRKPVPRFRTRAKMLWDDDYFYVGVAMEEPHVWGTLTEKNSIIFHDNDFEIFIDPDNDNHNYYEFEINALGTIWELTLEKPYRDGGPAIHGTNLAGLKSAVHIKGTLNDPSDVDEGWSVEVAVPFAEMARYTPAALPPRHGDQWRVDFSRVEWLHEVVAGRYRKVPDTPEDNWIWSPPGVIDMHRPERWGYVQFSAAAPGTDMFKPDPTLPARDLLMEVYNLQRAFRDEHGCWAETLVDLESPAPLETAEARIKDLSAAGGGFSAAAEIVLTDGKKTVLHVDHESRILVE
jgi:hypothetical protein